MIINLLGHLSKSIYMKLKAQIRQSNGSKMSCDSKWMNESVWIWPN